MQAHDPLVDVLKLLAKHSQSSLPESTVQKSPEVLSQTHAATLGVCS